MSSKTRLDELKQNVLDLSNKKYSVEQQHSELAERKEELLKEKSRNQEAMARMVRSTLVQSELVAAKEREFLKDKIEHFGYKQDRTTEAIIKSKDELTDEIAALKKEVLNAINAHKEAYELKSRRLEEEFEQKRKALESKYELLDTKNLESNYNLTTESKETLKKLKANLGIPFDELNNTIISEFCNCDTEIKKELTEILQIRIMCLLKMLDAAPNGTYAKEHLVNKIEKYQRLESLINDGKTTKLETIREKFINEKEH